MALLASCVSPSRPSAIPSRQEHPAHFDEWLADLKSLPVPDRESAVRAYLAKQERTPIIEGKSRVHFVWYGNADSVEIEGDATLGWRGTEPLERTDCGDRDLFHISYSYPPDAQLHYRFIVDGERELDSANPNIFPEHVYGDRMVLEMPEFTPTENLALRHDTRRGKVLSLWLRSDHPDFGDRLLQVYSPYGYNKDGSEDATFLHDKSRQYPLLLVNDGTVTVFATPFKRVLDNLIHDGKIEPVIVAFVPAQARMKEYLGKDSEYARYLVEEVLPLVESEYRIRPGAADRAISGISFGGNSAMVTGLRYPEVFGNIAAQGGGYGLGQFNGSVDAALSEYASEKKATTPLEHIYMDVGVYDLTVPELDGFRFLDGARRFHERMQELQVDHVYREINGGHQFSNWVQHTEDYLLLFFGT